MDNNLFNINDILDTERNFDIKDSKKSLDGIYRKLIIHFKEPKNLEEFNSKYGFNLTSKTSKFWFTESCINKNLSLFNLNNSINNNLYKKEQSVWPDYKGMPEYISRDCTPFCTIYFYFKTKLDFDFFIKLTNYTVTDKTKYVYFPEEKDRNSQLEYVWKTEEAIQPIFPIYIISKGRWDTSYTAKNLMWMRIKNFYITVEEQEIDKYANALKPFFDNHKIEENDRIENHLLVLDKKFQEQYDTVDPEGDKLGLPVGSGAARNFNWWHASTNNYKYHWTIDDNIFGFYRLNNNQAYRVQSGAYFRSMEEFILQHKNIVMAGPQYNMFIPWKEFRRPIEWNTRVYSCNLIRTNLNDKNGNQIRWRCRYNEDTDLSLRILKEGYSTCLFVPFLQDKAVTQSVKGGNTNTIYHIGTDVKSKALARLHPDVTDVVIKYGRTHHQVNYNKFKNNNPMPIDNYQYRNEDDRNFGMQLIYTGDTENECRRDK